MQQLFDNRRCRAGRRHPLLLLWCVLVLANVAIVPAQETPQDSSSNPGGLRLRAMGRTLHGRLHPDGWLVMTVTVANTSDEELTARAVAGFPKFPALQSARLTTLPPNTEKQVDLAIYVPPQMAYENTAEVEVAIYQAGDGGAANRWDDVLASANGAPQQTSLPVSVELEANKMATYLTSEPPPRLRWQWPGRVPYYDYEFVMASRVHAVRSRATVGFEGQPMPLLRTDWENLAVLVVSNEAAFEDAATVLAMEQFVNEGGRLWLMLDRIATHHAAKFLGSGQSICELDVVELNSFDVQLNLPIHNPASSDLHWDRDEPVKLKRVMQTGGRVSHEVNGWPAAIWMPVGYGEVLLTTLADSAWLEPGTEHDEPVLQTKYHVSRFASPLAMSANEPRFQPPVQQPIEYPLQRIGNPVLPRSWIMVVLGLFLGVLGLSAVIGFAAGQMRHLGWIAPSVSLAVGGLLVLNSTRVRMEIPETHAKLQMVQVSEQGRTASVREQGIIYQTQERGLGLHSDTDGYALADASIQTGINQYLVEGHHRWQLRNMAWPAGTSRYRSKVVLDTDNLIALGTLDGDGLTLKLPPQMQSLEDPVIAYAPGKPMIGVRRQEKIVSDGSLMSSQDRWVADSLISDEQQRRIGVYQAFFGDEERSPPRVSLLGWTELLPGVHCDQENFQEVGATLISLPIRLQRPPLGQAVLVPAGLIRLQKDLQDEGHTSAYDERTGKWSPDLSYGLNAQLKFMLPDEVVPFQADGLELELFVRAPKRTVRILARTGRAGRDTSSEVSSGSSSSEAETDRLIELVRLESPTVPWKGKISDPAVLASLRDGELDVTLEISERTDVSAEEATNSLVTWRLEAFQAQVTGARVAYGQED